MKFKVLLFFLLQMWLICGQAAESPSVLSFAQEQEIAVLRAQLESIEKYQDQILSVVLWSLGAVIAMSLGLAAFNWFANKVSYERDIQAIKQETQAGVSVLEAQLKSEIGQETQKITSEIGAREESMKIAIIKELSKRIDAQTRVIDKQAKEILDLQFENVEREAEDSVAKKRYEWAIYKYCDLLNISVKQGSYSYQAGEILDKISQILDKPEVSLSSDNVTKAIETFSNLPPSHLTAAQNLIPKIKKAHGS
ncbi:MAG: hypothetical protein Q8L97_10585 [Nitrosomonas sp.]|uniref:hypothetical protein n=1 Tax=Nitrosomonas sp. TaxID=42353 RepID=UPI00272F27AE|nr:hypothetical protein [Nitrosomonas sp.]MDP1550585.1 hypothetical protein [Nitrosomonas sp.]